LGPKSRTAGTRWEGVLEEWAVAPPHQLGGLKECSKFPPVGPRVQIRKLKGFPAISAVRTVFRITLN